MICADRLPRRRMHAGSGHGVYQAQGLACAFWFFILIL